MDKRIAWENHNPKEFLENLINEQEDEEDNESWKGESKKKPIYVESPFGPDNIWIGHTNFKLTNEHFIALNIGVDGVESFKFLSPYRFVLSVGKLFDFKDVRLSIEKLFCDRYINYTNTELDEKIENEKNKIGKYRYWSMYVFPNGNIFTIKSDSFDNNFVENRNCIHKLSGLINGILLESDTCKTMKI